MMTKVGGPLIMKTQSETSLGEMVIHGRLLGKAVITHYDREDGHFTIKYLICQPVLLILLAETFFLLGLMADIFI